MKKAAAPALTESLPPNFEAYENAFEALAEEAIRNPDDEDLLEQIWLCVEMTEKYRDSRALHETILDLNPYAHLAWHNLGFACRNLGLLDDALEAFEYSYITNPQFDAGYREYGALAFEQKLFREALQCYREMLEHIGEESDIFVRIGECYFALGDAKFARAMYEKALKLDPHDANAYFRLGEYCVKQKEYFHALEWFSEAVKKETRRDDFHATLAQVYYSLGKEDDAVEHAWKAVEIAPDDQLHWSELARLLTAFGRADEALDILEQAFENAIERNELFYCRSACLFLTGERKKAIRQLRKALTTDFSRHRALFRVAPTLESDADVRKLIDNFPK